MLCKQRVNWHALTRKVNREKDNDLVFKLEETFEDTNR